MKPQKIALVDMDGTIADYSGQLLGDLEKLAAPDEPKLGPTLELMEMTPHLKQRMSLIKNQPGWWKNLPRLERGFKIIQLLRELDFDLHVATKGPYGRSRAWAEKVEWCRLWLPDASVHVVEEKSLLYGKVLVDDWPSYVTSWLEWRPRGLAIMPACEYNLHMENHPNVFLFRSEEDIEPLRKRLEILLGNSSDGTQD